VPSYLKTYKINFIPILFGLPYPDNPTPASSALE